MGKKMLVAVAAALMSSVGALHLESALAADAATSANDDSTVDASLDHGEERVSADADNQARLKDLRYAYFIGYNARAREDSKSYATLGDEVKHPQKPLAAPAVPASPKPVAERAVTERGVSEREVSEHGVSEHGVSEHAASEHIAPPRRANVQATSTRPVSASVAPAKQVSAPVASPRRAAEVRTTQPRQVLAQAEPVPMPQKRIPAQAAAASQKHVYAQVAQAEFVPPRHAGAPVASVKQVSVQVAPPKRVEAQPVVQPVALKQVSARATPLKLTGPESEPPILIPTQAVTALPDPKLDHDDDAQVAQSRDSESAQRAVPKYRPTDEEPQYSATQPVQNRQLRQYQNQQSEQSQQYATPVEAQQPNGYSGREYAPVPPPPRTVQASQYAPGQYQTVYAQSGYVPRPPAQATAQQVIMGRPAAYPAAYPADDQIYTPPELRRPSPSGYGNSAQPAGYQGWE